MEPNAQPVHQCKECGSKIYNGAPAKVAKRTINSSSKVQELCRDLEDLNVEHFELLTLNVRLGLIKRNKIAIGGGWACAVNAREVMRVALLDDAAALVFIHNHPSGDPSPSTEDNELTRNLKAAATLLGLRVVDHIIISKGGRYSYAETGALAF
jgi:DNA repair protein RadC